MSAHQKEIVVILTMEAEYIYGGAVPVFKVENQQEAMERAHLFENLLGAMTHQVSAKTFVIVRH